MRKDIKHVIFSAVAAVFVLTSVNAFAGDPSDHWERKKEIWEQKRARMYDQLDLSDEQKQQLQEHRESHRGTMKAVYEEIKAKKQALKEELSKPDLDTAKVRKLHNEIKALKDRAADHRLEGILQVREILTPEQFQKFSAMKEKRGFGKKGSRFHDGKMGHGFAEPKDTPPQGE